MIIWKKNLALKIIFLEHRSLKVFNSIGWNGATEKAYKMFVEMLLNKLLTWRPNYKKVLNSNTGKDYEHARSPRVIPKGGIWNYCCWSLLLLYCDNSGYYNSHVLYMFLCIKYFTKKWVYVTTNVLTVAIVQIIIFCLLISCSLMVLERNFTWIWRTSLAPKHC